MSVIQFMLNALFFFVNCVALWIIVVSVTRTVIRMEKKLDDTIRFTKWVKSRHDATYIQWLLKIQDIYVKEEKYEEAERLKQIIDNELEELGNENLKGHENKSKENGCNH